jgi:glycosyltransferase involved in cell wall biosynthesis
MINKIKNKLKDILRPVLKPILLKYKSEATKSEESVFFDEMRKVLDSHKYDAVVIFDVYFGFEVKMFQRPQHIAMNLADSNILYLYKASKVVDKDVTVFKKMQENLYLINNDLYWLQEGLFDLLEERNIPRFVQMYSTCFTEYHIYLKKYLKRGFKIIYEYIDDLSDEIAGFKISDEIKYSHEYMLKDSENVYVVASADKLYKEVIEKRGTQKAALVTNGVQYDHFANISSNQIPEKMKQVVDKKKPIIGYYGALAKWFDYELLIKLAKERTNYEIVLIGIDYDKSLDASRILDIENVNYLGTVDYKELPKYAKYFDVCTIPFVINDITEATSPVKLFEYMALGHPIVTTALPECRKYKSSIIAETHDEFIKCIDRAVEKEKDPEYINMLREEAQNNNWKQKALDIKSLILS